MNNSHFSEKFKGRWVVKAERRWIKLDCNKGFSVAFFCTEWIRLYQGLIFDTALKLNLHTGSMKRNGYTLHVQELRDYLFMSSSKSTDQIIPRAFLNLSVLLDWNHFIAVSRSRWAVKHLQIYVGVIEVKFIIQYVVYNVHSVCMYVAYLKYRMWCGVLGWWVSIMFICPVVKISFISTSGALQITSPWPSHFVHPFLLLLLLLLFPLLLLHQSLPQPSNHSSDKRKLTAQPYCHVTFPFSST